MRPPSSTAVQGMSPLLGNSHGLLAQRAGRLRSRAQLNSRLNEAEPFWEGQGSKTAMPTALP